MERFIIIDIDNSRQRLMELIEKQFGYAYDVPFEQAIEALFRGTEYICSDHVEAVITHKVVLE